MFQIRKDLRKKYKIERIKQAKREKLIKQQSEYTYDKVFTYHNFVESLNKCNKGVSWKASVQNYSSNSVLKLYKDYENLNNRKLPMPISDKDITIYERGKERKITPIHIKDRVIQKVLCDNRLVPVLSKPLIYDNGASLKGKGVMFSRDRMEHHLRNAVKEFGNDFYVLSFDFKDYFNSIPHSTCHSLLNKFICDEEIVNVTMKMIKSHHEARIRKIKDRAEKELMLEKLNNDELKGICLGSQVSQVMALLVANDVDHYIKDVKRCKNYTRYMDDGVVFLKTKEELKELLCGIKKISDKLGLQLNMKKTHITKISKGFTFLKVKYFVNKKGKIIKALTRKGVSRMRRKLKKYRRKVNNREMTLDNVYDSIQSWLSHAKIANSYKTVKNMLKLYDELFEGYRISKKWKTANGGKNSELLQTDKWEQYRWGCVA